MRLQDVKIPETGELILDIMELSGRHVLLISDGKAKLGALPPHAETRIKTHDGKVRR